MIERVEEPIKYIVAGSFDMARWYARLHLWGIGEWEYVIHPHDLDGLSGVEVFWIEGFGTWRQDREYMFHTYFWGRINQFDLVFVNVEEDIPREPNFL